MAPVLFLYHVVTPLLPFPKRECLAHLNHFGFKPVLE